MGGTLAVIKNIVATRKYLNKTLMEVSVHGGGPACARIAQRSAATR